MIAESAEVPEGTTMYVSRLRAEVQAATISGAGGGIIEAGIIEAGCALTSARLVRGHLSMTAVVSSIVENNCT